MGAHAIHARGLTNTGPAREALERTFERMVDPAGILTEQEREQRVRHAKSLHYSKLAHKRWRK